VYYIINHIRSGLAWKHGIDVLAGVIDSDYRDKVQVILINLGQDNVQIKQGDRIAQIIFEKIAFQVVLNVIDDELSETVRGVGGFGSTGV